jgi:cephalosporin hydroxylase
MMGLAEQLQARIPGRALHAIRRARGRAVPRSLSGLEQLERLKDLDQAWLRDPGRLANLIRQGGLSDHHPHVMPVSTHWWLGKGLQTMQYPHQFAAYLVFLSDKPIASYVEIGAESGGSFAWTFAYLEATGHRIERAIAVEPQYAPGVAWLERRYPAIEHLRARSTDPEVRAALKRRSWDLILIDGDHSYSSCRGDFDLARELGAQMIAFHDIVDVGCPGVQRVWQEIRDDHADEYEFHEFIQQYEDVTDWTQNTHFGIGVAVAKGR